MAHAFLVRVMQTAPVLGIVKGAVENLLSDTADSNSNPLP